MGHSLLGADTRAHLRIVVVALIAGTLVVAVGLSARMADRSTAIARTEAPVLKAGKPEIYSSSDASSVR